MSTMSEILQTIPLVRIFDEEKAREYYCDWLDFSVDWEHRFEPNMPLYMQISLGNLTLHLSGHAGDCTPGSSAFIRCRGLREWQEKLVSKNKPYFRAEIKDAFWGGICMYLTDPFGNKLLFSEQEPV